MKFHVLCTSLPLSHPRSPAGNDGEGKKSQRRAKNMVDSSAPIIRIAVKRVIGTNGLQTTIIHRLLRIASTVVAARRDKGYNCCARDDAADSSRLRSYFNAA